MTSAWPASPSLVFAVRAAVGETALRRAKLDRLGRTARGLVDGAERTRRLARLEARGYVPGRPTLLQLAFGAWDMYRFCLVPSAHLRNGLLGAAFWRHQALRVLEDPASMLDPVGLLSERDTIVGHLLQVVHFDPTYDLQLLEMFEDGLDALARELALFRAGRHPRQRTLATTLEDPAYPARLEAWLAGFLVEGPAFEVGTAPVGDPDFLRAERTFGSLSGYLRDCLALPPDPAALVARAHRVRAMPGLLRPSSPRARRPSCPRGLRRDAGV
ncbi:MAG TPA: hypothetical protein RMH85_35295 [Polyangiaceae bacterium LLY-WYZ-15_(1-7)]|nr:hypothetical protein [Sandaracinus sp.]HJL03988.1 hypothetical protein [Polyangiaceae bacterium LLY-WYZ-15_(1-7)]MBJ69976.1 hypothetical protein [Sandaracinus sp.]HJL13806.1 hypothetical protein [Polyangiaceae bacterium LLY-WYZ-15_(1-7)]HJL23064.1 hypothetical protein [Polyangiaceae bacterium LLY-WYZ-15_(1-7)]